MANDCSDVIIVGGGIVGTSAAFFLVESGCSVTLLERHRCGQFASGTNFGNLRRQGRPISQLPLANRAHKYWLQLESLLDESLEFDRSGHLRVCYSNRAETESEFMNYAAKANEHGLDLQVLTGRKLKGQFPFLGDEVVAGSYSPMDGQANPRLVSPAFARAADRGGAMIREQSDVTAIHFDSAEFTAECSGGATFKGRKLLVAAGAWGHRLSRQAGEPVSLASYGPTLSVTEPLPLFMRPSIGVFSPDADESVYCRQISRGNVIIGGGKRNAACVDTARSQVAPDNVIGQWRQIRRLVPRLSTAQVIRSWAGVEGYTPDRLPVIGESRQVAGLYYGFGFSGEGFQLGPGVGNVLAELIAHGRSDVPLKNFDIGRFDSVNEVINASLPNDGSG